MSGPLQAKWKLTALVVVLFLVLLGAVQIQQPRQRLFMPVQSQQPEYSFLHILDVGHGQAILLQSEGKNILIDGGASWAGHRLLQSLKQHEVRTIDALFISRASGDYVGALRHILPFVGIAAVYDGSTAAGDSTYELLTAEMKMLGASYHRIAAGDRLQLTSQTTALVLAPILSLADEQFPVDDGLGMILEIGRFRILLAGSLSKHTEESLVRVYGSANDAHPSVLQADVLIIPRFGAGNAAGTGLLHAVRPKVAIIQVGPYNEQGLPELGLLERLKTASISVYRTDRSGSIHIWTDGASWGIQTEGGGGRDEASADQ